MRRYLTLISAAALLAATAASAKGTADAGATKTATCLACHGANGNSSNPEWPNLAGQNASYILDQLKHWHANTRVDSSSLMPPMAAALSEQDMEDLAAYYSQQTPSGLEADPSYWEAGQQLYRGGDKSRNIPACMACHGPVGRGNPAAGYPALRAQHSVYTVKQLTNYASEARYTRDSKGVSNGGAKGEIMHTIAGRLSQEDIRNLASYLQGMR
ncbi:MAG: c-type cytochrome [Steroidobacteraceae bacterium]